MARYRPRDGAMKLRRRLCALMAAALAFAYPASADVLASLDTGSVVRAAGRVVAIRDPQQVDTNVYWFALDPGHASYAATIATLEATADDVPSLYGTYEVADGANGYTGLKIAGPCYGLNGLSISASGVCRDIFNYICSKNPNYASVSWRTNQWGDTYKVWGSFLEAPQRLPTTGEDARLNDALGIGSKTIKYVAQTAAGTGDGSSYQNRKAVADYFGTTINADILVLCGLMSRFRHEGTGVFYPKSGTADARTQVVSHPVDTFQLMGGVKLGGGDSGEPADYTNEGGGTFSIDVTGSAVGMSFDTGTTTPNYVMSSAGGDLRALTRVLSEALCRATSDSYYLASDKKIFIHLADGSNPKTTTYVGPCNYRGVSLVIGGKSYFDVFGGQIYQSALRGVANMYSHDWAFYCTKFRFGGAGFWLACETTGVNQNTGQFVDVGNALYCRTPDAPANRRIQGVTVEYYGDGLYDGVGHCVAPSNTIIRDTLFQNIGKEAFGINIADNDSHSCAVLGGWIGATIRNNAYNQTGWLPVVIYFADTGFAIQTDMTDGVVANSSFASDTSWTKGGSATISGGAANLGVGDYVEQQITIGAGYTAKNHCLKMFLTQGDTRVRIDIGTTSGGTNIVNGASFNVTSNETSGVCAQNFTPGATSFYIRITALSTINVLSAELLTTLENEEGFVSGFPAAKRFNNGVTNYVCQPATDIDISRNLFTNPITHADNSVIANEGMAISLNGDVTYGYAGQISNVKVRYNRVEGTYGSSLRQKWQLPSPYDYTQIEWAYNVVRGADLYGFRGTVSTFTDENGLAADNSFYFHHNDVHVASGGKYVFLASTANPSRHNMVLDYNTYRIQTGALGWESAGAQVDTDIADWRTRAPTGDTYDTNSTHVALGA